MREQRWESQQVLNFQDVLKTLARLERQGIHPADPDKESIGYIEEWHVSSPDSLHELERWPIEDVTMIHSLDNWQGDFFLLAGRYHTIFQQYQSVSTYCSISHPWHLPGHLATLHPQAMFWVGFRYTHSFIRIRLHTCEVIAPGDSCGPHQSGIWLDERHNAFQAAINLLELPVDISCENNKVSLRSTQTDIPFFCSWPDAFGPCQFEFNSSDAFAFLVPASGLANTHQQPTAPVRIYLTGFPEQALHEFQAIEPHSRFHYRCSAHTCFNELPDMLRIVGNTGRLYMTICEFYTQHLLPDHKEAVAVIGVLTSQNHFQLEVRFNRIPLSKPEMEPWLKDLLGYSMTYAPLSPFP